MCICIGLIGWTNHIYTQILWKKLVLMKFFLQFNTDIVSLTASAFLTKHANKPSKMKYVKLRRNRKSPCVHLHHLNLRAGNGV